MILFAMLGALLAPQQPKVATIQLPDGFAIDLRSTSRVGESDLGANAARINAFRELWQATHGEGD